MVIKKATKEDFKAIEYLLQKYPNKPMVFMREHLNKHDIALQARHDDGSLIGFVWGGLMANHSIGYIDLLAVDPAFSKHGVAQALLKGLLTEALKRGVKKWFGMIAQDEFHDACAVAGLKSGFKFSTSVSYTCSHVGTLEAFERMKDLEK